jgi:hypothetical protein
MEHSIGETFDYLNTLLTVEAQNGCNGCYFFIDHTSLRYCVSMRHLIGNCSYFDRADQTGVVFKSKWLSRPIGEVFQFENKFLKVVPDSTLRCLNCYLHPLRDPRSGCNKYRDEVGACSPTFRPDKTSVSFVNIANHA